MLVQFTVGNYLSFKEPQTLSLVASRDNTLEQNTFPIPEMKETSLVKSIAIYGANASGKSNLIKALHFMEKFVILSAKGQEGDAIDVTPFKLCPDCLQKPSEFEIVFIRDGQQYVYGFTADNRKVHDEWLTATTIGGRMTSRLLFSRKPDGEVEFGASWKGEKKRLAQQVRDNALLLSVAAQLNNPTIKPVFQWFLETIFFIREDPEQYKENEFTKQLLHNEEAFKERIMKFINAADLGICDLRTEDALLTDADIWFKLEEEILEQIFSSASGKEPITIKHFSIHRRVDGSNVEFDFNTEESAGTKRLFALAGPWLHHLLEGAKVFVVDEFGTKLHPILARLLIEVTHKATSTPQLIFATHDCTLLDRELFRRDQIWFTEKDKNGATNLYSLWDYKVRNDEDLQGRYLQGRYGAVPYIGEWSFGEE